MSGAFSVDSSCMIAAVCSWHESHAAAARAIEDRLDGAQPLVVAAHAMLEAYAVLTRLPPPHRLAPGDAWALVQGNFVTGATVASLDGDAYVDLLERTATARIAGGRSYDPLIAATLVRRGVESLLTLNPRHFHGLEPALSIVDVREPA